MHLVFLNQYYPPDVAPTGVMLQAVVGRLLEDGHEVTVICAEGGYAGGAVNIEHRTSNIEHRSEEACSGCSSSSDSPHPTSNIQHPESSIPSPLTIIRLGASRFGRGSFVGKLADYASYYFGAAWTLLTLHPRPARIIALTTPPYLSVLARLVSKIRSADHEHWVMDLYPDVMVAHGMLAGGGWKHRLLTGLARWGFGGGRCGAIVTLGPDMAERVKKVISDQSSVICEEEFSGASGTAADIFSPIQNPKSKIQNHQSLIHWVPLWGSEVRRIGGGKQLAADVGSVGLDRRAGPGVASGVDREKDEKGLAESGGLRAENDSPDVPIQNPESRIQNRSSALRTKRGWRDNELIVMYSGNMGLGHRFGEFLAAAKVMNIEHPTSNIERRSEDACGGGPAIESSPIQHPTSKIKNHPSPNIRFVFYGTGKRRGEIETFIREHPDALIELHDYAPAEELAEHLLSADVHLASLDAVWTGTMVPSKLQGIFTVGRPVIFVGSLESSIGCWIKESGGGWVVEPEDVEGLMAALEEARDSEVRRRHGMAAGEFAKLHFDRKKNATRVAKIFTR